MKIKLDKKGQEVFDLINARLDKSNNYIVGGYIRDILLGRKTSDIDFSTDCDPSSVASVFPYGHYFEKFGTVSFTLNDVKITIASMRKEKIYSDYRHPTSVEFVKSIDDDYIRRDFRINSLYLDSSLEIIDPTKYGLYDIENKQIVFIGNAKKRIIEDPLRIIRAYRFAYDLGFSIDYNLEKTMFKFKYLIKKLNPIKVLEEVNKVDTDKKSDLIKRLQLDEIL